MKTFYNKLIKTLTDPGNQEKFHVQSIAPVSYIDLYAGQDLDPENFELFSQPAVFVEWNIDHQGDVPTATITLYCCFEQMRDTSNISTNQELGLKFLDYVDTINEIVQDLESEATGKLELESEGFNKMDSIVDIYLFTYKCSYTGKKKPLDNYQEGEVEILDLKPNLVIEFDD